jgi:hypothetical protein
VAKTMEKESIILSKAMNNRKFDGITIAKILVTTANVKPAVLKTQLIEKISRFQKQ